MHIFLVVIEFAIVLGLLVLLHELGHAMGLAHTTGAEVMNPYDQGYANYQSGDRAGLSRLGSGQGCVGFYQ